MSCGQMSPWANVTMGKCLWADGVWANVIELYYGRFAVPFS
jgi:hypothetical protein